jgi:hypothetical protein
VAVADAPRHGGSQLAAFRALTCSAGAAPFYPERILRRSFHCSTRGWASMGEVIHVAFGTEREWEQTHEKTVDGLVTIGTLFGDDEGLMRAKADCVYQLLREIVEEVPSVQITTRLPENLTPEQLDALTRVIKDAALKGIEIAMTHSVQVLMGSIYDLCTSKLHAYRQ